MSSYADLDEAGQVALLRPIAVDGAAALGLNAVAIELALHGYNTTFKVTTTDGSAYAVRVLTNSASTPPHLEAQHAWMHALSRDTSLLVPDPVVGPDGVSHAMVSSDALPHPARVVAATWLPGQELDVLDLERAHELGVTMATMHQHAEDWRLPPDTELPVFDEPLFGDPDLLSSPSADDGGVIALAFERALGAFERMGTDRIAIHGDLHTGNLKWHGGRLAVFDFDDSGLGTPALDLAITTFYIRDDPPQAEAAMREGYQAIRLLPEVDAADFEAMLAARQLLLANALLGTTTASLRAEAEDYLRITVDRLRHWLRTGRFTRVLRP